ncbi:hypothetical protein DFA_02838 [Cavenderia fasciculata]|uniref:Uncharacterized protein n=1 Tax=Cavenderia fasciculata TaxID=261658 RepID=F4PIL5_CACFS|nr:uncharacterized protein DFA_02838 [Cavenderia fasciculata]EGG24595.1 hypothetical protein DFA_02838 [Cavenderia fasciculata]|eukprot:XP_004362446.1 hypothetical protein DFA_02838 [Cavenderia fasciculata]
MTTCSVVLHNTSECCPLSPFGVIDGGSCPSIVLKYSFLYL